MKKILEMMNINNLGWLSLSVIIICLDQFTKFYATKFLTFAMPIPIIEGLNFTLAYNTGAAFSLLHQFGGLQVIFFTILALVVSCYLIWWLFTLHAKSSSILKSAITLVLGGALGNMYDRISLGYVIDFIEVYYNSFHWPIFNIADSAITIGALLLFVHYFKAPKAMNQA